MGTATDRSSDVEIWSMKLAELYEAYERGQLRTTQPRDGFGEPSLYIVIGPITRSRADVLGIPCTLGPGEGVIWHVCMCEHGPQQHQAWEGFYSEYDPVVSRP